MKLSVLAAPIWARVTFETDLGSVGLYAGAGAGMILTRTTVSTSSSSRKDTRPTASGVAGISLPVGRGAAVAEIGYIIAGLEEPTVHTDLGGFYLAAGYSF